MFARALIVLLVVLNLGVGLWWLARPATDAGATRVARAEGPELFLLEEVPLGQRLIVASASTTNAGASTAEAAEGVETGLDAGARCYSLGPFIDASAAVRARGVLAGSGVRLMRVREQAVDVRGWNVSMPPLADRAAANAVATRLREAGFEDLFILSSGASANGIALGRYGSESSARQRVVALREAGFEAVASPIGDGGTQHWLDLAVGTEDDIDAAQRTIGVPGRQPLDCTALR